jgi:hypothetical protein
MAIVVTKPARPAMPEVAAVCRSFGGCRDGGQAWRAIERRCGRGGERAGAGDGPVPLVLAKCLPSWRRLRKRRLAADELLHSEELLRTRRPDGHNRAWAHQRHGEESAAARRAFHG